MSARWAAVPLCLLGLAVAASQLVKRAELEKPGTVALVLDWNEVVSLAAYSDKPLYTVLEALREAGASHVAIQEDTWEQLQRQGRVSIPGGGLGWVPAGFVAVRFVREGDDKAAVAALRAKGLAVRAAGERGLEVLWPGLVAIPQAAVDVPDFGFGYRPDAVALAKRAGLGIVARPMPGLIADAEGAAGAIRLAKRAGASIVLFAGRRVVGFPAALDAVAEALKSEGLKFARLEMSPQAGADTLARLLGGRVVRAHSITRQEMEQSMTPKRAIDRFALAVRERGVRLCYVRLFFNPQGAPGALEANLQYLRGLRRRLEASGFSIGEPEPVAELAVTPLGAACMGAGIGAAAWLAACGIGLFSSAAWLAICAGLVALAAFAGGIGRDMAALLGVLSGASLPFCWIGRGRFKWSEEGDVSGAAAVARAAAGLVLASACTFSCALMAAGLLSDTLHISGTLLFRGVKLSLLLPPLVALLVQVGRAADSYSDWLTEMGQGAELKALLAGLREAASAAVRYWHIAVAVACLAAAALMVVRSGNEPLFGRAGIEMRARAALMQIFGVRPRTKEFAVGHPLLVLGLWMMFRRRRRAWLALAGGAIGQASLANTFCHLHTPILISCWRAWLGVGLGLAGGLILVLAFWALQRLGALAAD